MRVLGEALVAWPTGGTTWLLLWLVKGSLLLALLFPLTRLLRGAPSSARHLVWTAGLVLALVLPVLSTSVLQWRIAVPEALWPAGLVAGDVVAGVASAADPASAPLEDPAPGPTLTAPGAPAVPGVMRGGGAGAAATVTDEPAAGRGWHAASLLRWVFGLWLVGASWLLLRLGRSALRVRRLVREGTPVEDSAWTTPLFEAADRLDLPEAPRLLVHAEARMPMTCGVVRPAILLPPEAGGWTEERRRAVLCHELAHVRRRDLVFHLVGRITCALYWFQPLAWSAARRMRAESERACDDLVLILGARPSAYADHLLQIATAARGAAAPVTALPLAQPREFEARLLSILAAGLRREPLPRAQSLAVLGLLAVLALPLIALTPAPPAGTAQSTAAPPDHEGDGSGARQPRQGDRAPVAAARAGDPNDGFGGDHDAPGLPLGARIELGVVAADEAGATGSAEADARGEAAHPLRDAARADARATARESAQTRRADPRVRAELIRALDDPAPGVRRNAAWALAAHRDTSVVSALAAALRREPQSSVREMMAWALAQQSARLVGGMGVAALGETLLGDTDAEVRLTAAWALGTVGGAPALPPLERALRGDPDAQVRTTAAWALGTIARPGANAVLADAMADEHADVRERAAWALGQIADRPAPASLSAALRDPARHVRAAAAWALGTIADPASAPALQAAIDDPSSDVGATALWALSRLPGDAAIDALTRALRSEHAAVREAAAAALGGRGSHSRPWPWPWPWPRPMP